MEQAFWGGVTLALLGVLLGLLVLMITDDVRSLFEQERTRSGSSPNGI